MEDYKTLIQGVSLNRAEFRLEKAVSFLAFAGGNKISSPIVLEHFIVMEDYKKQAKSDINLKKGRAVDVIEKRECGELVNSFFAEDRFFFPQLL